MLQKIMKKIMKIVQILVRNPFPVNIFAKTVSFILHFRSYISKTLLLFLSLLKFK